MDAMFLYVVIGTAFLLGVVIAPPLGKQMLSGATSFTGGPGQRWDAVAFAFEAINGATCAGLVSFLGTARDPFTAVISSAIGLGAVVVGLVRQLDGLDDSAAFVRAVGRTRSEPVYAEAVRRAEQLRRAYVVGGAGRCTGAAIVTVVFIAYAVRS